MIRSIIRKMRSNREEKKREQLKKEFVGRLRIGKRYGVVRRTKPPAR